MGQLRTIRRRNADGDDEPTDEIPETPPEIDGPARAECERCGAIMTGLAVCPVCGKEDGIGGVTIPICKKCGRYREFCICENGFVPYLKSNDVGFFTTKNILIVLGIGFLLLLLINKK